ncbi:helix-turn-helix domain-containing protein [Shewanella sp. 202IG2-18]|uniref:helix-turn-helix domain-containing protein n=1 Tax=Parashewanella hymeniacidonis TaxID=2807618 RepID=UPI0019612BF0|nr:helix-turn-helix domain-containing protein [Parashewanella hymeniacidonis]
MDECSDYTGLTKNYIYKLTHLKLIPHFKPNGKKLFFKRQDIDDWLLSNKVEIDHGTDGVVIQRIFELNELLNG